MGRRKKPQGKGGLKEQCRPRRQGGGEKRGAEGELVTGYQVVKTRTTLRSLWKDKNREIQGKRRELEKLHTRREWEECHY